MSEEEKDAIEYYKNYSGQVELEFEFEMKESNWEELKRYFGITEEDSFENHQIRIKTLINLIKTQNKMIKLMAEQFEIMKDKEEAIDCFIPREYSDIDDCVKKDSCQECIIEYFRNKAKESE